MDPSKPPLSVVIPTRGGLEEIAPVLEVLGPAADAIGAELLIVGNTDGAEPPPGPIRLVSMPVANIYALRHRGIADARGRVVAIGEDHAIPRDGWCEAVIRAHAEHPEAGAVASCLVNATDATTAGRANFLAFAAAWQPPMRTLPFGRPPPSSALSFKREALEGAGSAEVGWLECELIPLLFAQGSMVADERIVVDHYQDHGGLWSIRNAFDSARSSYGYQRARLDSTERRRVARWALGRVPAQLRSEARAAAQEARVGAADSALIALISSAAGVGGAAGALLGPGRSPARVA
jgi:hypothetical protein